MSFYALLPLFRWNLKLNACSLFGIGSSGKVFQFDEFPGEVLYTLYQAINQLFLILQDRLVANDFIQCRKVAEHVVEKIVGGGDVNGTSAGSTRGDDSTNEAPEERVELLCCDQVS